MSTGDAPKQRGRQLWLVPAPGQTGRHWVAEVAVRAPTLRLHSYAIPDALREATRPGCLVSVPYGRAHRPIDGLCVRVSEQPWDHTRKPISAVRPGQPWLSERLVELGLWVSDYYVCAPWKTFAAILPAWVRQPRAGTVRDVLCGGAAGGCPEDQFVLTAGQQDALGRILAVLDRPEELAVFLLFGVPGSGKTEVYVRALREVIRRGRQAILLIPEIALATQLVERLARRFERVAVLHSQLSPRVRCDTLAVIASGRAEVVIGTRSAVFAPCPRLGIIVVDEEQEGSFKNLAAPFYHARDVAIKRGQLEHVPVVLGSATPALETWFNAQQRAHFQLLRLPERVPGARLPEVRLVLTRPARAERTALLSPDLCRQVDQTLSAGQQVILLHNRRGYAPYLRCAKCGLTVRCPRCGHHLVYHRSDRAAKCHRCGAGQPAPTRCLDSTCGGALERSGSAIQRLEEEVRAAFPTARLLRLDSDTMRRRADYEAALRRFEAGQADILLGTQMVAKGLDFPRVRLVGVVEADAALALPDFRAAERVFQLITQVVGRAGRREGPSLALVQTSRQPAAVVGHALRMEYEAFAADELAARERFFYPPVARLVRLVCADARPHRARQEAERLADTLGRRAMAVHAGLRVDPAEACVIRQLRGMLRYQVLLRGPRDGSIQRLLHEAAQEKLLSPRVQRFTIDVDPLDLL